MKKGLLIIAVISMGVLLSGCKNKQIVKNEETRANYEILYTYDYDKTREVVEEKKTVRELAKELMLDELGITNKTMPYKEVGIDEDNGVFVTGGITDGDGVPKTPSISKEEINKSNENGSDVYENMKLDSYEALVGKREDAVASNEEVLGDDEEKLLRSIQEKVDAQNKKSSKTTDSNTTNSTEDSLNNTLS